MRYRLLALLLCLLPVGIAEGQGSVVCGANRLLWIAPTTNADATRLSNVLINFQMSVGGACEGNPAGVIGGRHASIALAANGGFSSVSPFPWLSTRVAGQQLCLLKSSTGGTVSGVVTYRGGP